MFVPHTDRRTFDPPFWLRSCRWQQFVICVLARNERCPGIHFTGTGRYLLPRVSGGIARYGRRGMNGEARQLKLAN